MDSVDALLKQSGAQLVRQNKHIVYKLPNGQTFVRASTASDHRAEKNAHSVLKRLLNINQGKGEGERRARKIKTVKPVVRERFERATMNPSIADQLRVTGATEAALREQIATLESELDLARYEVFALQATLDLKTDEIAELEARQCLCWWCRLKRQIARVKRLAFWNTETR